MSRIFGFLILFSVLFGDVMYEVTTRFEGMPDLESGFLTIRNFIKGGCVRIEMKSESSALSNKPMVMVLHLDKGVSWILDLEKKEYVELPLDVLMKDRLPGDSKCLPQFKIEKLPEIREILKIKCEKYLLTMTLQTDNEKITITQIMWLGRDFLGYQEIKEFNRKLGGKIITMGLFDQDKAYYHDLQKKIAELDGFPLELEFTVKIEGRNVIELRGSSTVNKITTVPINNRVFEIPEGYQPAEIPGIDL